MQWTEIMGHTGNVHRLQLMLASGRMPHALLFCGPAGIGKALVAKTLVAAALCMAADGKPCGSCQSCRSLLSGNHPDLLLIQPEGTTVKIEQIRQLQSDMALAPYFGDRRAAIIEDADQMTLQAANSLLKTLEEPPENFLFILVAGNRQLLPETIISRCLVMAFQPLDRKLLEQALSEKGFAGVQALAAARLSGGRLGQALRLLEPGGFDRRNQAAEIVAALGKNNMQLVWNTAAMLDKYERKEVIALLDCLTLLLHDLLMIVSRQDQRLLYNIDLVEPLTSQAQSWGEQALITALAETAASRKALQANANPRLTGEALLIKLCDLGGGG